MSTALEDKRLLLEELEVIDWAINQRLKRVPEIHDTVSRDIDRGVLGHSKRSRGQVLLLRHEVALFLKRYDEILDQLDSYTSSTAGDDGDEKRQRIDIKAELIDHNMTFDNFDKLYVDIIQKSGKRLIESNTGSEEQSLMDMYKVFGCNSEQNDNDDEQSQAAVVGNKSNNKRRKIMKKKKRILSLFAKDLKLSQIFTKAEKMGQFVDLEDLFKQWLAVPKVNNELRFDDLPDYFGFLGLFTDFNKQSQFIKRDNIEYARYLTNLYNYLCDFWIKIQPLNSPERSIAKIQNDANEKFKDLMIEEESNKSASEMVQGDYKVNEDGSVFCFACDKLFAKETVYKAHLPGKKHLKNVAKLKSGTPSNSATSIGLKSLLASNLTTQVKLDPKLQKQIKTREYQVDELAKLLAKQIQNTRNEIERKKLLTTREMLLEKQDELHESEDEYAFEINSDEEDHLLRQGDDDSEDEDNSIQENYNPLKLPLGPDGKPIPYWLWKVQGLAAEHTCEICGGFKYQGRRAFSNHFTNQRHLHGLRCLGIDSDKFTLFKDISVIKEAVDLWAHIKKQNRDYSKFQENAVQVEDEEGNVMSEKIYNQLKKQGII